MSRSRGNHVRDQRCCQSGGAEGAVVGRPPGLMRCSGSLRDAITATEAATHLLSSPPRRHSGHSRRLRPLERRRWTLQPHLTASRISLARLPEASRPRPRHACRGFRVRRGQSRPYLRGTGVLGPAALRRLPAQDSGAETPRLTPPSRLTLRTRQAAIAHAPRPRTTPDRGRQETAIADWGPGDPRQQG